MKTTAWVCDWCGLTKPGDEDRMPNGWKNLDPSCEDLCAGCQVRHIEALKNAKAEARRAREE